MNIIPYIPLTPIAKKREQEFIKKQMSEGLSLRESKLKALHNSELNLYTDDPKILKLQEKEIIDGKLTFLENLKVTLHYLFRPPTP
jgi:hypothetical protein